MKTSATTEIHSLKSVPLFQGLKPMELSVISLAMENVIFEAGEIIFQEGEEGEEAYIILSGEVEVYTTLETDGAFTLNVLTQGEIFGEMALFGDGSRSASVKALRETLVGMITKEKLYGIIQEFPRIAIQMLKVQTRRFQRAEKRLLECLKRRE
jgi:CRP-like cAMP-binding protein